MKRTKGFTLIEILTVIAIIGFMMGIAVPMFHIMARHNRVTNAAIQIERSLSAARQQAITDRKTCEVEFDTGGNRYKIGGGDWIYLPEPIKWHMSGLYMSPPSVLKFTASGQVKDEFGVMLPDSGFYFSIVDSTTIGEPTPKTANIHISGLTGRVHSELE